MFKKDVFGKSIFWKKFIIRLIGTITYFRFNVYNRVSVQGVEILKSLPNKRVLLVSNHQTYFADVVLFYHIFQSALLRKTKNIKFPGFLICPKTNLFFVAAEETMNSGFLPKILRLAGAITVKRTWRKDGKPIKRTVDKADTSNIGIAIRNAWVVSFPQGTTTPFAPGRKGTAHIIKEYQPVVVPIVIDGLNSAFNRRGFFLKKLGVKMSVKFKKPLVINYDDTVDNILEQVMDSIEQSERFNNENPQNMRKPNLSSKNLPNN